MTDELCASTYGCLPCAATNLLPAHALQVMLFGGLRFEASNNTARRSTDMFILDFAAAKPHWRHAAVSNINVQGAAQLEFPNTGVAALPQAGTVALMHRSVRSMALAFCNRIHNVSMSARIELQSCCCHAGSQPGAHPPNCSSCITATLGPPHSQSHGW